MSEEIRCPSCNSLHGKMTFGIIEIKCKKCAFVFTKRVDINETVNVLRSKVVKPPLAG